MRVVKWERIGDRRIRLMVTAERAYAVTIETLGPNDVVRRRDAMRNASKNNTSRGHIHRASERRVPHARTIGSRIRLSGGRVSNCTRGSAMRHTVASPSVALPAMTFSKRNSK